jgi:hypothetical protein
MLFVGHCFRRDEPSTKYDLAGWTDLCNNYLDRRGLLADADSLALIAAVIGAGDVSYRLADFERYGQPVELGLDLYTGRKNTEPNAWRLLKTSPLRPPLPSRYAVKLPAGRSPIPAPKIYRDGVMTEVAADTKPLWS